MAASAEITLPYQFTPRDYQIPFLRAMDSGCKRACLVWHRRAGKDKTALQIAVKKSSQRKGGYYYYFPTGALGRKILWEGKDNDGVRFIDHFPPGSIVRKNDTEMLIETCWGSHFRICGTDNLDVVGTNPVGTIWSEYALQDPKAWALVQPILRANDGWAIFCYTPRGRNHGYDLYQIAQANRAEWFCQLLTIEDTGAINRDQVEHDIATGIISRPLAQQEYWCDFNMGQEGSYYGAEVQRAEREQRIGHYPYDPAFPVYRFADFGDVWTAAFDVQFIRQRIRVVNDYWDNAGTVASHGGTIPVESCGAVGVARSMQAMPYVWGREHYAGPDFEGSNSKAFQATATARDTLRSLGYNFRAVVPHSFDEGIEAARLIWPMLDIDEGGAATFLSAAKGYGKLKNERLSTDDQPAFHEQPAKTWHRHMMDALRHLAVAVIHMHVGHYNETVYAASGSRTGSLPVLNRMGF